MLDEKGDFVICDFGFIKQIYKNETVETKTDYVATRWYRSPEILLGRDYDQKSDIWALGLVIMEMITRLPLLPGSNTDHMI